MPINRTALKNYAPKARQGFIAATVARAAKFGISETDTVPMQEQGDVVIIGGEAFSRKIGAQRRALAARIKLHGFGQTMEEVALARVTFTRNVGDHDYHLHSVELHNTGAAKAMTLAGFVTFCSGVLQKPVQGQLVVLGDMSLGGGIIPVENIAECLQMAFDCGGKRILLPMSSVGDIQSIPGELFAKFQTSFYNDPVDAVFKALGVEC